MKGKTWKRRERKEGKGKERKKEIKERNEK